MWRTSRYVHSQDDTMMSISFIGALQGSTTSVTLLEAFAEKLAGTFINGELYVADWNPDDSVEMKVSVPLSFPILISVKERECHSTSKSAQMYRWFSERPQSVHYP